MSANHLDSANPFILDFINFKVQDLPEDHTLSSNLLTTFIIKPAFSISLAVAILTSALISSTLKSAVASS
jgi:hypothetical protein